MLIVAFLLVLLVNMLVQLAREESAALISYNAILEALENGEVSALVFGDGRISVKTLNGEFYSGDFAISSELLDLALAHNVEVSVLPVSNNQTRNIVLQWIIPVAALFAIFFAATGRRGGHSERFGERFLRIGRSSIPVEKRQSVTFENVAGAEDAKESLREIVDYLNNPKRYAEIGATQPKGALLVGPPGAGKTLMARAVAGEAKVAFFSLTGSDFVEMFVGVGASRVRNLFRRANRLAPCIIFIDEIDAIGKRRDGGAAANDEREQTLNQLLSEMDGFESTKGVVILGATNRPEILDPALLRPGRFDRRITVDAPDVIGREKILIVHAKRVKLEKNVDLSQIAKITPGASGADLANIINEAALSAVRDSRHEISQNDLSEAVEIIIAGKEIKERILSPEEKRYIATHETGHAMVAAFYNAIALRKITIVPRSKGALGYVMYLPKRETFLSTEKEIRERIIILLAGRAAEETRFGERSTGAADDVTRATALARSMVTVHGMARFGPMALETEDSQYQSGRALCSEKTLYEADQEVKRILEECYKTALDIINSRREKLLRAADILYERETIQGDEFLNLIEN